MSNKDTIDKYSKLSGVDDNSVTKFISTPIVLGIVTNSSDYKKLGRVQVRIPSLHKLETDVSHVANSDLPWAKPGVLSASGNDYGQYIIPVPGTRVWILFEDGNPDKPVYLGGMPTKLGSPKKYNTNNTKVLGGEFLVDNDDTIYEILESSPTVNVIFKSIKGATIYTDDEDFSEMTKIVDQSGQYIVMRNCSEEQLDRRKGRHFTNHISEIKLVHDNGTEIVTSDLESAMYYQQHYEYDGPYDEDNGGTNAPDNDINPNPISSVSANSSGIDLNYDEETMALRVNGQIVDLTGNGINLDIIYPVGSVIYNTDLLFDPNIFYEGTVWNKIEGSSGPVGWVRVRGTPKNKELNISSIYPVGSIIHNVDELFNPNITYKGTVWERTSSLLGAIGWIRTR